MAREKNAAIPFKPDLSVGEVSRRSGIAVSALHFYETKGLIHSRRTDGNQRRFPRDVLRRVSLIKVAQRLGVSLQEVRAAFAELPADHNASPADWKRMASRWRASLDGRIAHLTELRDQLTSCIGCGCLSLGACPLRNPDDRAAKKGPGARFLPEPPESP